MAAVIETIPYRVAFAGSPMWFKLKSNDAVVANGSKFKYKWTFDTLAEGYTDRFQVNNEAVLFTFTDNPTDNGTDLPLVEIDNNGNYYALILPYFSSNKIINDYYDVYLDPTGIPGIIIEAKEDGYEYELIHSIPNHPSSTVMAKRLGGPIVIESNFKHYIDIQVLNHEDWESVFTDYLDINDQYESSFDLSNVLKPLVGYDEIDFNSSTPQKCTSSSIKYRIVYAQSYGTNKSVAKRLFTTDEKTAILGGIGHTAFPDFVANNDSIEDLFRNKFMEQGTISPRDIKTNEPAFLSFINLSGAEFNPYAQFKLFYTDDTTEIIYKYLGETLDQDEKLIIPVGHDQCNLNQSSPTKTIKKYQVRLGSYNGYPNGTFITKSSMVEFVLNRKPEFSLRYFIYGNSLGNYSTLRTTGQGDSGFDIAKETAETILPQGYKPQDAPEFDFDLSLKYVESVSTGFYTKYQIDSLADIFLSSAVYRFIDDKSIPVTITTKNPKKYKDDDYLYATKFDYSSRFSDAIYTADSSVASSPQIGDFDRYNQAYHSSNTGGGGNEDLSDYYTKQESDARFSAINHTHSTIEITHTDYGVSGTLNGSNKQFTVSQNYRTGSTKVYLNGVRQFKGAGLDYTETAPNKIVFVTAPEADSAIIVDFIIDQTNNNNISN